MSTPARMVELGCPSCEISHWEIDSDYRGADLLGEKELSYAERTYFCPHCRRTSLGFVVRQKSPPEFFLQPHTLYPMSRSDFEYWVAVLRQNIPDATILGNLYTTWYPSGSKPRLSSHAARLLRTLLRKARMVWAGGLMVVLVNRHITH